MEDFKIGDRVEVGIKNIPNCMVWLKGMIIQVRKGINATLYNVQVDGTPAIWGIWTTKEGLKHGTGQGPTRLHTGAAG